MPDSSGRSGADDASKVTPELVAEIAEMVYLRLQQELRHEHERARGIQPQPRRRGGK